MRFRAARWGRNDRWILFDQNQQQRRGESRGRGEFLLFLPFSGLPFFPFSLPAWFATTREQIRKIRMGALPLQEQNMDFIGGGRDGRQQTELKVHFSLSAARVVHNMCRSVCSVQCVLQCVLAGVNVCRRQVVLPRHGSVISARLVPAPNPAHRMCQLAPIPYNVPTIHVVFRAQCVPACPLAGCNWVWGN